MKCIDCIIYIWNREYRMEIKFKINVTKIKYKINLITCKFVNDLKLLEDMTKNNLPAKTAFTIHSKKLRDRRNIFKNTTKCVVKYRRFNLY